MALPYKGRVLVTIKGLRVSKLGVLMENSVHFESAVKAITTPSVEDRYDVQLFITDEQNIELHNGYILVTAETGFAGRSEVKLKTMDFVTITIM